MRFLLYTIGGYWILVNLLTFVLYGVDKLRAKQADRRIPERTLLLLPYLGGSVGALLGMWIFRHKTKHLKFRILVPLALLLQIAVVVALYWYLFVMPK
ncbi:MAG: DUF1294 domain-containing protein [Paludibacteraceae bacterium]